jgi:hypothetical protein
MENNMSFIGDMTGKTVLVKTHGGVGLKEAGLMAGEYKGVLLGFDGTFIKLEYDVKKFLNGNAISSKDIMLINAAYIITLNEYRSKEE